MNSKISGATNPGVPQRLNKILSKDSLSKVDKPKSAIIGSRFYSVRINILSSFKSLCIICAEWR